MDNYRLFDEVMNHSHKKQPVAVKEIFLSTTYLNSQTIEIKLWLDEKSIALIKNNLYVHNSNV